MTNNYLSRMAYWLDSHVTPLGMRPLFSKPLFKEGELEEIVSDIRKQGEKYERETGKPYNLPAA